ncbi:MAG: mechanosensitive ion channel family protein [Halobacteriaceae archaeon]
MVDLRVDVPPELEPTLRWLVDSGWRYAGAVLAVLAGYYVGSLVVQVLARRIYRRFERPSVTRTVIRGVRMSVFLLGVFAALTLLGFRLGNIVLSVTVFSAVLGIVLAPIVGSVINGLFVLADQPYEIGDMIEFTQQGTTGFVEDITLRYTKIFTLDNTFLVIPNSTIRERDVINYSAEDERTRLSLELLVTYEGDLAAARSIMERSARNVDQVIEGGPQIRIGSARYPAAPTCHIDEYADHGVLLTLRYWVKQPYRLLATRSAVQEAVWEALEATDDVQIAYPHQHHVFDEHSGTARVSVGPGGQSPRHGTTNDEAADVGGPDDPTGAAGTPGRDDPAGGDGD